MTTNVHRDEERIIGREEDLRDWFTHGKDAAMREIDGVDIGWGGAQRWVTANMPGINGGKHLDFACGYGTFLAQLGWRFPRATLYGLNIDYAGPHASIRRLLQQAQVQATLVQADARQMPFADQSFDSASCFLGLQDIQIGFGPAGVTRSVCEALRVLTPDCCLTLVDELPLDALIRLLENGCAEIIFKDEFLLDIRWARHVAEKAIELYSRGWTVQSRAVGVLQREIIYKETYRKMKTDMERQLRDTGFYVPHGPLRMVIAKRTDERHWHGKDKGPGQHVP